MTAPGHSLPIVTFKFVRPPTHPRLKEGTRSDDVRAVTVPSLRRPSRLLFLHLLRYLTFIIVSLFVVSSHGSVSSSHKRTFRACARGVVAFIPESLTAWRQCALSAWLACEETRVATQTSCQFRAVSRNLGIWV